MKKYLIYSIVMAIAVLAYNKPTQAQAPTTSFYRPYLTTQTGIALHNDNGWMQFTEASFDVRMDGLYTLSSGVFDTSYVGLAKLTGNCRQDPLKVSDIGIRMTITGYIAPIQIARTSDEAFSFSFPFHANDFTLEGYNYTLGRYDVVKCDLVIEVVE